ncbi:MAG: hypothetical protein LAP21_17770 [Acidobacteriia bacterium]|nr:hypothetical protein [Terriglobia bacterium]
MKPSTKKKLPIISGSRRMKFPQVKGKTLEEVNFSSRAEDHSITLVFRDKTALRFGIEPGFTMFADLENWKTGDVRVIRRWPEVRSWLFRE